MELRINRLDEATHRAAKMLAAHKKISLNKFVLDAIHHECIRIARKEGLVDAVLGEMEAERSRNGK
jgi:hypothetical protein